MFKFGKQQKLNIQILGNNKYKMLKPIDVKTSCSKEHFKVGPTISIDIVFP